jgi:NAD(P)-dependent dehydrogenase (short-subunit alcohol dehydrogenase family)
MTSPVRYPDLAGKVVFITGGASGIGAAHCRAFAQAGARVAFVDIQQEAGEALCAELPGCEFISCDLTDLEALGAAIEATRERLGPISCLINNAAVDQRKDVELLSADDFEWMMDANLRHVIFAAQAVIPHMRALGGGAIVNTSSTAWLTGIPDLPLYSAAKAAIVGFTNSLARRVGAERIRVNAIAPGFVPTARQRSLWFDADTERAVIARQCLPDAIQPGDVANLALFLCSDAARMITKQVFVINAGLT